MIHHDPNGIDSPPINDPDEENNIVNHASLDMTNPLGNIQTEWFDDFVRIYDPDRDISFNISYEGRTEGQISAEVTKILEYLTDEVQKEKENISEAYREMRKDFEDKPE